MKKKIPVIKKVPSPGMQANVRKPVDKKAALKSKIQDILSGRSRFVIRKTPLDSKGTQILITGKANSKAVGEDNPKNMEMLLQTEKYTPLLWRQEKKKTINNFSDNRPKSENVGGGGESLEKNTSKRKGKGKNDGQKKNRKGKGKNDGQKKNRKGKGKNDGQKKNRKGKGKNDGQKKNRKGKGKNDGQKKNRKGKGKNDGQKKNRKGKGKNDGQKKNRKGKGKNDGQKKNRKGKGKNDGQKKNRKGKGKNDGQKKNRKGKGKNDGQKKNRKGKGKNDGQKKNRKGKGNKSHRDVNENNQEVLMAFVEQLKGNRRLMVIATPSDSTPQYVQQREENELHFCDLALRKVTMANILSSGSDTTLTLHHYQLGTAIF
ncbi:protein qua-1-like isoform X2 [Oncorhynchus keta]|uniref:protein qua-1-like isoform X2 n=1 Tax=Oncorhynchus keta TaxID=8018 RepID=UPI00227CBC9E|nr:protein qua-1-like isoform X2 [Oncorhynchus keta]